MYPKRLILGLWVVFTLMLNGGGLGLGREKVPALGALVFPGAIVKAVVPKPDFIFVRYETFNGGVRDFYAKKLRETGWAKVSDLSEEEATDCGGDWGGTYEKDKERFKLHVCGFDQEGALTKIDFYFYNMEPEQVLGGDFRKET